MKLVRNLALFLAAVVFTSVGYPDVIETDKVCDFWGYAKINGQPASPGTTIDVYDPDGVHCGSIAVIGNDGLYPVLHVYGDDTTTKDVDEGAKSGDTLVFKINGHVAVAKDEDGNIVQPTWTEGELIRLDLEIVPPTVTVEGSPAKEGDTITVTATWEAGCSATFSIEGVSGATNIAMTESNGTYTGTYTVQAGDNVKDATVSVTFTKEGQTQTDTSQKVTIDTTPPTIQITSPADGSFTNQTSIEVQGTVSDDNLDTVTVNGVQATVTDGSFTAQIDLPDGDGDKTITATATDVVGHESSDSIAVILDTTPPQIQITQPVDGSWTNQTSITVTGTVSDANLDTVTVNGVQATVTDGSFTAQGVQLQEGDNTITATATDKAANTAQVTVTVKLDTVKPSLSNPTAQPTVVKNGDTITVTVEATDEGSGIASVTANVDGIDTGAAGHTSFVLNPVEGQQNVYSGTYTISQNNTASNNDYKIVITATDYAGNTQTDDTTTVTLRNLNITLQSDKSAIPPGGEAILTATLTDASGAGLEGETVEIGFAPDSQNKKGDLSSVEDIGNGQYQCTYTAPQDFEGQISFIATVDGVTSEVLTIIVRSITMEITVDPDTLVACGTQTATVTVTMLDENNDPISGEEIKFTVSDDNGSIDPETGTTGDDGKCTVTYTAGIQAGTATITATAQGPKAQGVSATAQVTLTPAGIDPDGSTLTVQPGEVSADDPTVTVTVRVVDVHGNPISGASVKILVDGKKVEILMDGTGVPTATTDQNGRLVAQIQLPHQAGDKTISTTANDTILTQIVTVKVTPGKLASLEISPDTALVPIGRTRQFTVTGADAEGNPITPTDVTWEVIGEIGTIDQNGLFTATTEGVGKIQATADGVTDTTGDIKVVTRIPGDCAGGSQTADFPNGEPDGKVDIFDLVQMGSHWHQTAENTTATQAEFEAMDIAGPSSWEQGDGVIDIFDLIVLADNFGVGTGAAAPDLIARLPILSTAKLALITPTTRTTMQRESEIRTLLGSEFKLDLLAEGLKGLKGYTFQIAYDPNAFEILGDGGKRFAEGSLMKGMESFSFAKPDRSSLTAAGVVLGRESVRVDSGTLGSLSLKAKSAGEHTIVLRNVILIMDDGKSFTLPELRYRVIVHEPIEKTKLLQNYPNPFNPETWIPFQLKEASEVTIRIYDLHGNLIRTLHLGYLPAGLYLGRTEAAYWDGRNELGEKVASGIYIYQMQAGSKVFARKMVILK